MEYLNTKKCEKLHFGGNCSRGFKAVNKSRKASQNIHRVQGIKNFFIKLQNFQRLQKALWNFLFSFKKKKKQFSCLNYVHTTTIEFKNIESSF